MQELEKIFIIFLFLKSTKRVCIFISMAKNNIAV